MSIRDNVTRFRESVQPQATLVAVSKTKPLSDLITAYDAGQRHFGENKVQEMCLKWDHLPKDIKWHMIGHLQRNKVKYIAPFVHLIHSVDSIRLLVEINKQAMSNDRVINCLLQVHIAQEDTKYGFNQTELTELLASNKVKSLTNLRIIGLMGMATYTDDQSQIAREFNLLKSIMDDLKFDYNLTVLSMGMTGDYKIALEHGSNMVRIGSAIFGGR